MRTFTLEEIRDCFARSTDFNEIFDAFQASIDRNVTDLDSYRLLFCNHALSTDEIRLFGEKIAAQFPLHAYDVFLMLAHIFEVTQASNDNFELTMHYYQKAAQAKPESPDPYLDACDCHQTDLNIPPLTTLTEFLKQGCTRVPNPVGLFQRLAYLSDLAGDMNQSAAYRKKAEELSEKKDESGAA